MAGSMKDRLEGWINGKISGDTIPDDIKKGFMQLADQYQKNAYDNYRSKVSSINTRTGTKLSPLGYQGDVGGNTDANQGQTTTSQSGGMAPEGTIVNVNGQKQ